MELDRGIEAADALQRLAANGEITALKIVPI
jgi:hypothetical protein